MNSRRTPQPTAAGVMRDLTELSAAGRGRCRARALTSPRLAPSARRHFTQLDQVTQLVGASVDSPDAPCRAAGPDILQKRRAFFVWRRGATARG